MIAEIISDNITYLTRGTFEKKQKLDGILKQAKKERARLGHM